MSGNATPAPPVEDKSGTPSTSDVSVLPSAHWTQLGPVVYDDADPALDENSEESTASLASSILKYRTMHGRTYHSERGTALYWGTNDAKHSESLDMLHHSFLLVLDDKLFLAPIENPKRALDLGTGTGLWAFDFAEAYPDCTVIGTDVSPIQPTWVPSNLTFEIEDYTSPWTYAPGSFSFVHMRYLLGTIINWETVFKEAYKVLEPGGWVESCEPSANITSDDNTIPPKSALTQWGPLFWQGGKKTGRSFRVFEENLHTKAMRAAGFKDIVVKDLKMPFGTWPLEPRQRQAALYSMASLMNDADGFILFLTGVLGWTREEVGLFEAHTRKMLRDPKYHCYIWVRLVYGRKPFPNEL